MRLSVPKRQHDPLAWLLSAPDTTVAALERALLEQKPGASLEVFAHQVATNSGLPVSETAGVVRLLADLYRLRDEEPEERVEAFLESVCDAVEATGDRRLSRPLDGWAAFKERLRRLLTPEASLWITGKTLVLSHEHARVLCRARCLTDARPIFRSDVRSGPVGFTIMHSLMLTVHRGGDMENIFVAMDPDTLQQLSKSLDRALKKGSSLSESLAKAGLAVMPSKD